MSFPKDKPPHSVKVLHSWINTYAKETGQVPERIMRSVSYMIASLALERAQDDTGAPLFLIKGGVMIELRLGLRARATKDLDAVFRASSARGLSGSMARSANLLATSPSPAPSRKRSSAPTPSACS